MVSIFDEGEFIGYCFLNFIDMGSFCWCNFVVKGKRCGEVFNGDRVRGLLCLLWLWLFLGVWLD